MEDNPGDIRLLQEAFKEANVVCRLHVARDGEQAVQFLERTGNYTKAPRPDLILLDLNLPRKSGKEVLTAVKQEPSLRAIPVLVLSTSKRPEDIAAAYDLQANCYIPKPVDLEKLVQVGRQIESFWMNTAILA